MGDDNPASSPRRWVRRSRSPGVPSAIPEAELHPSSLPRQWLYFRRSGPPVVLGLILDGQSILDAPRCAAPSRFIEAFATGNPIVERRYRSGRSLLADFLRKFCAVLDDKDQTKYLRALYWIDADGLLFSPPTDYGGVDELYVRRAFEEASHGHFAITAVCRCRHREARLLGFLNKMKFRETWVFGWYGAAARDVEAAADGGDLGQNWTLLGADRAHGRGFHVSAQDQLSQSALLSFRGMDGRQTAQVLFCALALGWREIIPAGSPQSQPSSPLFHTGTDVLAQPTWHVFWEGLEETQILPLYIVSFSLTRPYKRPGT